MCCSDMPISATAMSDDKSRFYLGGVDGIVRAFNVEDGAMKLVKKFACHDLPVTAMTCPFQGDEGGGESKGKFNVVTVSADSRVVVIAVDEGLNALLKLFLVLVLIFMLLAVLKGGLDAKALETTSVFPS